MFTAHLSIGNSKNKDSLFLTLFSIYHSELSQTFHPPILKASEKYLWILKNLYFYTQTCVGLVLIFVLVRVLVLSSHQIYEHSSH